MTNILTAVLTAYCACRLCCGPHAPRPTASGVWPTAGRTIAAPRWVPFGSRVRLPDGTWRIVHDRLHPQYTNRWDVFLSTHAEAKRFGIRTNQIVLITTTNALQTHSRAAR